MLADERYAEPAGLPYDDDAPEPEVLYAEDEAVEPELLIAVPVEVLTAEPADVLTLPDDAPVRAEYAVPPLTEDDEDTLRTDVRDDDAVLLPECDGVPESVLLMAEPEDIPPLLLTLVDVAPMPSVLPSPAVWVRLPQ